MHCIITCKKILSLFVLLIISLGSLLTGKSIERHEFEGSCYLPVIQYNASCVIAKLNAIQDYSLELRISDHFVNNFEYLCEIENRLISTNSMGNIALARRGQCSFENKTNVATLLGYEAIILINNENTTFVAEGIKNAIPFFVVADTFSYNLERANVLSSSIDIQIKYGNFNVIW